jgi:hypothetical protein
MEIDQRIDRSLERIRRGPELLREMDGILTQSLAAIAASRGVMGVQRWPHQQTLALVVFETREVNAPEPMPPPAAGDALRDRLHREVKQSPHWLAWLGFPIRYR